MRREIRSGYFRVARRFPTSSEGVQTAPRARHLPNPPTVVAFAFLLLVLIHIDGLELRLQFGRNDGCRFGFPRDESLEATAELLAETPL